MHFLFFPLTLLHPTHNGHMKYKTSVAQPIQTAASRVRCCMGDVQLEHQKVRDAGQQSKQN